MTGRTIPVSAQWALEGKQPDGEDYRILSCSTGELNRDHFADALSRFQVGELNDLPQVSMSYARLGAQPGMSHVALAIYWYATEGQRHADRVEQRDNQGRPTAYTSYFCLPYGSLAEEAIGYRAMYEALRHVMLTVADGPPQEVPIAVPASRTPGADDLAVRVAPLLLTGRPVCVLGAENTTMLERLEFIDGVMELLPYGLRSRMTAATLTRATNRDHRFRLFFSSARRAGGPDWVVNWGEHPDYVPIPSGPPGDYLEWLQDKTGSLARLTDLTNEMGFGTKGTLQAFEAALGTRPRRQFRPRRGGSTQNGRRGQPPPPPPGDPAEKWLRDCIEHVQLPNASQLRSDIVALKKFGENEMSGERRRSYRELISSLGLLQPKFLPEDKLRHAEKFYDALLRLATGPLIDYEAYCWVEKSASVVPGTAPPPDLLMAISKINMTVPRVSAIVHWHLRATDNEKKLNRWLISKEVTAAKLIFFLAENWRYPQHARIFCDVTVDYLKKASKYYEPQEVRQLLCQHGFLARTLRNLYPDDDQHQIYALQQFLKAAYPQPSATPGQELSRPAVVQILNGNSGSPPTSALLAAVLMLLHKPTSWELAWKAYTCGSLNLPHLDEKIQVNLQGRLPDIDAAELNDPEPPSAVDMTRSVPDPAWRVPSGPAQ